MQQHDGTNAKGFTQPATPILPLRAQVIRVIYVTQLNTSQVSDEEKETIAWISARLGEKSWQDALIIFTDGHTVKPARKFATILKKRTDMLRIAIAARASWDIASSTTTMTINAPKDPLSVCQRWLQECLPLREACTYLLIQGGTKKIIALPVEPRSSQQHPCPQQVLDLLPVPRHCARAFVCFYLCIAPVTATGLFVAGILGYEIAMLINMIVWMIISFLDIL
jgi:hypothetical protein